jgi:hypothetical protein
MIHYGACLSDFSPFSWSNYFPHLRPSFYARLVYFDDVMFIRGCGTGTPVCQKLLTQGTLWYHGVSCRKWHKCSFESTSPIVLCPHSHYNQPLTVHTAVSVCYKRKSSKTALTSAGKKKKNCSRDAVGENKQWTRVNALSQSQWQWRHTVMSIKGCS